MSRRVYYAPKHAERAGRHRLEYRRDSALVWAYIGGLAAISFSAIAVAVVMEVFA